MHRFGKWPMISVIMPAYNADKYIAQAIESVLDQTYKQFELIIINDCSTDNTGKIISSYKKKDNRIVVITNKKNLKLARSLNKGISIAKGKYIARMDADDWSYPDRFNKQTLFMEKHPQVGILGGKMNVCDEHLKIINSRSYSLSDKEIRKKIFFYSPFSHPLIMIRKKILDKVGLYDNLFNPAEDYELYFRIGQRAKFANLNDVLLKYRVVSKSMTNSGTKNMELTTLRIRNKYFKQYHASAFACIYNFLEYLSVYIIPYKIKVIIFNYFRTYYC